MVGAVASRVIPRGAGRGDRPVILEKAKSQVGASLIWGLGIVPITLGVEAATGQHADLLAPQKLAA